MLGGVMGSLTDEPCLVKEDALNDFAAPRRRVSLAGASAGSAAAADAMRPSCRARRPPPTTTSAASRPPRERVDAHRGMVVLRTGLGGTRVVDMLPGDQLPRIC